MVLGRDMEAPEGSEHVRRRMPPPFLLKTYMLVEDALTDEIVSWNSDGSAFVVWKPAEFARDLLPSFFKHSNFSSFVRQLNTYGFRKAATSRWEFCNELFRKGEREQLSKIRRRKPWSSKSYHSQSNKLQLEEDQRSSATSSSSEYTTLVDENKRLKRENGVLNSELEVMKMKCMELLNLVRQFSQMEKKEEGPKLFGVVLGVEGESQKKIKRAEISSYSLSMYM